MRQAQAQATSGQHTAEMAAIGAVAAGELLENQKNNAAMAPMAPGGYVPVPQYPPGQAPYNPGNIVEYAHYVQGVPK